MFKIKISVSISSDDFSTVSESSHQYTDINNESINLDRLVQAFIYAIPKHEVEKFHVIEMYADGKVIGHGEV